MLAAWIGPIPFSIIASRATSRNSFGETPAAAAVFIVSHTPSTKLMMKCAAPWAATMISFSEWVFFALPRAAKSPLPELLLEFEGCLTLRGRDTGGDGPA